MATMRAPRTGWQRGSTPERHGCLDDRRVLAEPIKVSAASGAARMGSGDEQAGEEQERGQLRAEDRRARQRLRHEDRKSVSSGNSAWPTSTTATATIHIGTAIRNAWSAMTRR